LLVILGVILSSTAVYACHPWINANKYINIRDAELYGFEASAEHDLFTWLTLFGNIACVVGEDTDTDDYLSDIPPLNGLADVRFHLKNGKKKYWLELEGQLFDKQNHTAPGEEDTAGYSVFNIRSGIKLPAGYFENITLTLNVENLFDKKYHDHLKLHKRYLYTSGLNILAGLKVEFWENLMKKRDHYLITGKRAGVIAVFLLFFFLDPAGISGFARASFLQDSLYLKIDAVDGHSTISMIKMFVEQPPLGANVFAEYESVRSPDLIAAKAISGEVDFIIMPTNMGAKLYNKGIPYKMAAVTIWGNLYLVSSRNINTQFEICFHPGCQKGFGNLFSDSI